MVCVSFCSLLSIISTSTVTLRITGGGGGGRLLIQYYQLKDTSLSLFGTHSNFFQVNKKIRNVYESRINSSLRFASGNRHWNLVISLMVLLSGTKTPPPPLRDSIIRDNSNIQNRYHFRYKHVNLITLLV